MAGPVADDAGAPPVRRGAARRGRPAQRGGPLPLLAARRDRRRPRHPAARLPRRHRELGARLQHRHGRPHRQRVPRQGLHIVGRRRWNRRGAMVTDRYQHEYHHASVAALVEWAAGQDGGLPLLGIDNLPGSVPLESYDLPRRCILLFGQEGPGLSEPAREACVAVLESPSSGRPGRSTPAPRRRSRCTPGSAGTSSPRSRPADVAAHGGVRSAAPRQRRARGSPRGGGRARIGSTHARGRPAGASVDRARGASMPIATPEVYADMLDRAKAGSFAYPAINVSSSQTLNAALRGLRRGRQRRHHPGLHRRRGVPLRPDRQGHGHRLAGPRRLRARGGQELPRQHRAAHRPLPQGQARRLRPAAARGSTERVKAGGTPLFQSHMWDGSAVPLDENLADRPGAARRLAKAANVILEIEVGVVGGEEDGVEGGDRRASSTPPPRTRWPPSRRSASARTAAT